VSKPVRIQLSRRKGFNLQEASRQVNGLAAVNVARPGRWGNIYRVGQFFTPQEAAAAHREHCTLLLAGSGGRNFRATLNDELRGKNLACWCKPGAPCHADVLLELANG
jgi:hypothetical protein